MRTHYTIAIATLLFLTSCQKEGMKSSADLSADNAGNNQIPHRSCGTYEALQLQLANDPGMAARMDAIEKYTARVIKGDLVNIPVKDVVTIPVVVHVIYKTAEQNISDAQVTSQIDVLNEDFSNTNRDRLNIPREFKSVDGSVGLSFVLDRIIRKQTTVQSFNVGDNVKHSKSGGDDVVDPSTYLNIWVCNLGSNLLGYAQFPGGDPSTDGVVILYSAFGRTGTLISKYNLGRTATHEVGHWVNLRHIWGDATCGDDLVDDTPIAQTANFNCPTYPKISECTGSTNEMTMNYMDYTDDACMYMFTLGQKDRARAVFAPGGPRSDFAF